MRQLPFDISPQGPYFSVLRAAIWDTEVDTSAWPETVQWQPILDNFLRQAMLALVADALCRLPEQYALTPEQMSGVLDVAAQTVRGHYNLQQSIVTAFNALHDAGVQPILIKGEGLAQLYPKPNHRSVGDIDIHVGRQNFQKACTVLEQISGNTIIVEDNGNDYHVQLHFGEEFVEIHNKLGYLPDLRFQETYEQYSDDIALSQNHTTVNLQGTAISVPTPEYNAIYILAHISNHFRYSGIGLR